MQICVHNFFFHTESLWVAPEAIRQQNAVKSIQEMQYADVYSFAVILYEILSRKEPFEDDQEFLTFKGN